VKITMLVRPIWGLVLYTMLSGCSLGNLCDPDQILSGPACIAAPTTPDATAPDASSSRDPADQATGDAASTSETPTGSSCNAAKTSAFGDRCVLQTDCGCPTDVCAIQSGASNGFCTHTGCLRGYACPSGWTCFDLSAFQSIRPDTPDSICIGG
jgi:hypothetical protein